MSLSYTSSDVIGNVPGVPERCFSKPAVPSLDDFKRKISDASTAAPDTPMCGSAIASPGSATTSFSPMGCMSPMMRYDLPDCDFAAASPVPTAAAPAQVFLAMADGALFQRPIASALFCLPPTEEEENEAEAKAADAGRAEPGEDAGGEEDEAEAHADEGRAERVKKDGITWLVARGRPPTMSQLEGRLAEVKSLYKAKFGEDVDEEDEGEGEEEEAEVGKHADEDRTEQVVKDGITWLVARGRPPTMSQLEGRLAEVKSLYKAKFGEDVDEEEDKDEVGSDADERRTDGVEKDGITWVVTRGRPPTMSQLEDRLAEVKSLYKAKVGEDLDEEEEDEEVGKHTDEDGTEQVVKDGITWLVARGRPPTMSQLEDRLAEVKSLYKAKFGEDVDDEDEEDDEDEVGSDADEHKTECVEKDGITWVVARGRPPTISQLEDRLAEVKSLYKAKFGEDVDKDEDEDEVGNHSEGDGAERVVKDGITWVVARGRPPTMSQLEDRLAEVKSLYKAKVGDDLDEEEEEEDE